MALVELPRIRTSGAAAGLGCLRRAPGVVGRCVRRLGPGGGVPPLRDRGVERTARAALGRGAPRLAPGEPGVCRSGGGDDQRCGAARGAAGGAARRGHSLERVCQVVCAAYAIEPAELARRGSRQEARAALAYLARRRTAATHAELMGVLGVSRPESVPNLTRRFASWLSSDAGIGRRYHRLEEELDREPSAPAPGPRGKN